MAFILSIDQGTTQSKALLMDEDGKIIASSHEEFPQYYPYTSWVEHKNEDIKNSVKKSVEKCLINANIKPTKIMALGITNQRETTCLFDENSNSEIPFIVWQCKRSKNICDQKSYLSEKIKNITGLRLDPYFSASKLSWVFTEYPELYNKAVDGKLLFGTIDSFLAHWLSQGKLHITDVSNASRTMLMDISSLSYSDFLLEAFNIPKKCLPQVVENSGIFGYTKGLSFLPDGIPICSLVGDQQSALFAQKCFNANDAKLTLGTGAFLLQNIGPKPLLNSKELLCSLAFKLKGIKAYCLEGSAFTAGAAIQFLRDNLGFAKNAQEIDMLSQSVKDSDGVYFLPGLCGLGAPYWQSDAKGVFFGLTRGTKKAHMAKAVLESIALQNADIFSYMNQLTSLKMDGGMAKSDIVMQMHADLLGVPCLREENEDQTALGAAYLAGIAIGMFSGLESLPISKKPAAIFKPILDRKYAEEKLSQYQKIVKKVINQN